MKHTPNVFRHLKIAGLLILCVLVIGTSGYMVIEHLSLIDALYTTVNEIATTGNLVQPLSMPGRIFTICVIIFGVASLIYGLSTGMEFMIEGHFSQVIARNRMDNKIAALHHHAIICGFGRVGTQIVEDCVALHQPFVVIDENEENIQTCMRRGYLALLGDATRDDILREAGIQRAQYLLVATDNDAHNTFITLSARHFNPTVLIVARANHRETEVKLKRAGANWVLSPYIIGGHRMASLAFHPEGLHYFEPIALAIPQKLLLHEVMVEKASPLIGKTLAEVQKTFDEGMVVAALRKYADSHTVSSQQQLVEERDTLLVVGFSDQITAFQAKINTPIGDVWDT